MSTTQTLEQMVAEQERLKAQIAELRKAALDGKRNRFHVELSEFVTDKEGVVHPGKGGYKVTGLGSRFPVTLYPEQWEVIFANAEAIRACYNDPSNKAKSDRLRKA